MTADDRVRYRWAIAAGRTLNALFFLATSIYCLLTFSPFAYEQFIQPHVVAWLSNFVLLHADFYWLALFVTTLTLVPHLKGSPQRWLAWTYLAAGAAAGIFLLIARVLPGGNQPARSVTIALIALLPIVWLATLDHLAAHGATSASRDERQLAAACVGTAVFVWVLYAAAAVFRLRPMAAAPLVVGIAMSAVAHLTAFALLFLVVVVIDRSLGMARAWRQAWLGAVAAVALTFVLQRVVFAPISLGGATSWLLASAIAVAVIACASGIARIVGQRSVDPELVEGSAKAFALQAADSDGARRLQPSAPWLVLLVAGAYGTLAIVTTFDWGFMLQKLSALAVACAAFKAFRVMLRDSGQPARATQALPVTVMLAFVVTTVVAPRLSGWLGDPRLDPDFALDAYSAGDPSFRLLRQFLQTEQSPGDDAGFFAYLRANSSIARDVRPTSVDFVEHPAAPAARPPHIFLFLIDSLRRDYVAPYNAAVTFTPALAAFAADSYVFDRAFTRYGGTGLAVPSVWAGAMVAHKQYVTPFAPMNALAKLLDAGGYRRVVTFDHITDELFGFPSGTTMLDRTVPEMLHTFCGTVDEIKDDLRAHNGDSRPVFAHTRPLDLHIGNTRLARVPPGEHYPGFFEPYASHVRKIDACFGEFVAFLKASQLYDESIVIVTSDHGDSLGEGLRWGHGYTVFPEVIRIPLFIRLPPRLRERFTTDLSRVTFGTDLTPTLYGLLGYQPKRPRAVAGVPLFEDAAAPPSRRSESFVVASSYGAVYGLIGRNGRRLYIADAIEGRDYLYDLGPSAIDTRIPLTDAERMASRASIREQVSEIASWYGMR